MNEEFAQLQQVVHDRDKLASEVERLRKDEPERLLRIEREFRDRYPGDYSRMMAAHAARMEARLEQEKRKVERQTAWLKLLDARMKWQRPDSWKVAEAERIARTALSPDDSRN